MEDASKLLAQLGAEIRMLIRSCLELSWYSRGAWSYETVLNMSSGERDIATDFINKRLEGQAKAHYPIY